MTTTTTAEPNPWFVARVDTTTTDNRVMTFVRSGPTDTRDRAEVTVTIDGRAYRLHAVQALHQADDGSLHRVPIIAVGRHTLIGVSEIDRRGAEEAERHRVLILRFAAVRTTFATGVVGVIGRMNHTSVHHQVYVLPGWLPLIGRLGDSLAAIDPEYRVTWAQRRLGGLQFHATLSTSTPSTLPGDTTDPRNAPFWATIRAAEAEADRTCERCGSRDAVALRLECAKMTLCEACRQPVALRVASHEARRADLRAAAKARRDAGGDSRATR